MKLVQLNIWQGKILIAVSQFLKDQDADFICMQEIFSSDEFVPPLDNLSSLELLKKELNYPYVYFEPVLSFMTSGIKAAFGNAIFSKYPLKDQAVVFSSQSFQHFENWRDYPGNARNLMSATVSLPGGKSFSLANHHGYHEFNPVGSEKTVEAMQKVVDHLRTLPAPLVLAGDLNITKEGPAMRIFDGWLRDLTAENNVNDTLTEFGKVREVACDHILVSDDVKVESFTVSNALVSDHTPIIFEFDI